MNSDAIIGKWTEFLLKTFTVFIKVPRSFSGPFCHLAAWMHAKLSSEDLVNILKINEGEFDTFHSWYSNNVISNCKIIMQD